jgi:hypothetical protein
MFLQRLSQPETKATLLKASIYYYYNMYHYHEFYIVRLLLPGNPAAPEQLQPCTSLHHRSRGL